MLQHEDLGIERERSARDAPAPLSSGSASPTRVSSAAGRSRPPRQADAHARGSPAGSGSISRSNDIARFCAMVIASSSTMRSLTMPKRSTNDSHASLSAISRVGPAEADDVALSGRVAPVMRLTKTSAAGRSKPEQHRAAAPAASRNSRTRSGLRPPYCFSTLAQDDDGVWNPADPHGFILIAAAG